MIPPIVFAALFFYFDGSLAQQCYYPNQVVAPNDVPCQTNGLVSFCCSSGYVCLDNKICMLEASSPVNQDSSDQYWRGSCTDQTWSSPDCPLYCLNTTNGDSVGGPSMMNICPDATEDYFCIDHISNEGNCGGGSSNLLQFNGTIREGGGCGP